VAQVRNISPGHVVIHPNRDRSACKLTKLVVIAILLISIVLIALLTVGGWSELQGLLAVNVMWCLLYVLLAVFVGRWARGLLPIAAALAILLGVIAIIAGLGIDGTSWFDRARAGFAPAQSLFGGAGLGADTLGVITDLLIPVQAALVIVAMVGFAQRWNVELEVPADEARRRGSRTIAQGPPSASASASTA
jgi:signal transduction histidine kinase